MTRLKATLSVLVFPDQWEIGGSAKGGSGKVDKGIHVGDRVSLVLSADMLELARGKKDALGVSGTFCELADGQPFLWFEGPLRKVLTWDGRPSGVILDCGFSLILHGVPNSGPIGKVVGVRIQGIALLRGFFSTPEDRQDATECRVKRIDEMREFSIQEETGRLRILTVEVTAQKLETSADR